MQADKIIFRVNTSISIFTNWIQNYSRNVTNHFGFPTQNGRISLNPMQRTSSHSGQKLKMDGLYIFSKGSSSEQAEQLPALIEFEVVSLAPERIEVCAECSQPVLIPYFEELLEAISERYPETQEQLRKSRRNSTMDLLDKFLNESNNLREKGKLNFIDFISNVMKILASMYREGSEYGVDGSNKNENPHSPYKKVAKFLFDKEQTHRALSLLKQRWDELAQLQSGEHLYRASIAMQLAEYYLSLNDTDEAMEWLWLTYADDVLHGTTKGNAEQLLVGRFGIETTELERLKAMATQHRESGKWSSTEGLAEGLIKSFIYKYPESSVKNYFQDLSVRKAVILTALPVEYTAVRKYLANPQEVIHPQHTVYELGEYVSNNQTWEIAIAEIGPGNSGAAAEAERALAFFEPDIALFVGVAGGIKDVNLGDIVVATKVYGYESGKEGQEFQTRADIRNSSYDLEQRARAESRKADWWQTVETQESIPKVIVGPIAAGEKVVASNRSSTWKFLRSKYSDALAVEMEGIGFLRAAHANQSISATVVRGISDLIEGKELADQDGWQEIAARNAAAFAFQIIAKIHTN